MNQSYCLFVIALLLTVPLAGWSAGATGDGAILQLTGDSAKPIGPTYMPGNGSGNRELGDSCDDPFLVPAIPYTFVGSTVGGTNTYGNSAPDEWHQFTLNVASTVSIELCGPETDYDTYLYLLAADCTTLITSDDDGPECTEDSAPYEPSEIVVDLEAGTYVVAVDGYGNHSGSYHLDIDLTVPYVFGMCQPPLEPGQSASVAPSHNGTWMNFLRAERFGQATEIFSIEIYGSTLTSNYSNCLDDPMLFHVVFYEDGSLPGAAVTDFQIEAHRQIWHEYPNGNFIWSWNLVLPTPLAMVEGWFSVQSSGPCALYWREGYGPDSNNGVSADGGPWEGSYYDLAFCFNQDPVLVESETWGNIKAMFR